jgi:hypothetical protein
MEGRRSIGQTHWHNQEFIVSISGPKGGFLLISFLNSYSVVSVKEVEFAEDLGAMEAVEKFTDQGNRVAVFHREGVEASVVYTKSHSTILLGRKDHWRTCRAHGFPDMTFFQPILDEFL